jgi:von Willebrand factor type A domain
VGHSPIGLEFRLEVDPPSDVPFDATRVGALLTVTADSTPEGGPAPAAAEILIMDRSLSMAGNGKLDEAKRAVCAAIDTVRDGTRLGIIAGNHKAEVIYPAENGGLPVVDAESRKAAKRAVGLQTPRGGTTIGKWLTCAEEMFTAAGAPDVVRHAVLYTDGKNEHETAEELGNALARCTDGFVCDVRGLGDDWDYTELLRITEALHGTAEAVVTIADLTRDFTALMEQAQRIVVPRVYLGLRPTRGFELGFVRQISPVAAELPVRPQGDGRELHVPLGSWSPEQVRQYQVSLRFSAEALPVDQEMRAARVELLAEWPDGTHRPCAAAQPMLVRRRATTDFRPSPSLTRLETLRELELAIQACVAAQEAGDAEGAGHELRLAVSLAERLGDDRLRLLRQVSATDGAGRLVLRADVTRGHMQRLGLYSTRTGPMTGTPAGLPPAESAERTCPRCKATTYGRRVRHCETCGHRLDGPPPDDEPQDAL